MRSWLLFCAALALVCHVCSALTYYQVVSQSPLPAGRSFQLSLASGSRPGPYGPDLANLQCDVLFDSNERVRVRIYDPSSPRFEIPSSVLPYPALVDAKSESFEPTAYSVSFTSSPFGVAVTRTSDGHVLLNTTGQLVFEEQYLELSTVVASDSTIIGLGERVRAMALQRGMTYTMFNVDSGTPTDQNLYGSHPYHLEVLQNGAAHGVFLRSSNGIDAVLGTNNLTYKVIGGILDLTVLVGPTTADAVAQYHRLVGTPHMPPLWSLGFHQCRWGYQNLDEVKAVVANYSANGLPLETMWTDIDYMDKYFDFTWDPVKFPQADFAAFVNQLHANNQKFVVIVDPGISNTTGYTAYDSGRAQNVFIKRADGSEFHGKVWPGYTAFPDWFSANASSWWRDQIASFLHAVPYDGLWIDMNEISNFCQGECDSSPASSSQISGSFDPNHPPYAINNRVSKSALNTVTIDMDCLHGEPNPAVPYSASLIEYNVHNLFGMMEGIATKAALESITGKRSLVISRSTFAGSGHHNGHWLGDNDSTWESMKQSIAGILNMNLFGIPLIGADICGFNQDTNEELCARWMALGSFYPFSRNHNAIGRIPQEPYRWPSVLAVSKTTLNARYSLLAYYHTLFFQANQNGGTVVRPMVLEFAADVNTHTLDEQFMVGSGILVAPVLTQGATSVNVYLPASESWFNLWDYSAVATASSGWVSLPAPLTTIPVLIRGGNIIPRQPSAGQSASPDTVEDVRKRPFEIVVALDRTGEASGSLFLDDGVELSVGANALRVSFECANQIISTVPITAGTLDSVTAAATVSQVSILGLSAAPTWVDVNGARWRQFSFDGQNLIVQGLALPLTQAFKVDWQ